MSSLQNAVEALRIMQDQNSAPAAIKEATGWLENFQKTQEAWAVCDQLLYQPNNNPAAVFGATCLHRKMETNWQELPVESHNSLRESLLTHCNKFNATGPKNVLRLLCQALATLCVQMDSWKGCVQDLLNNYGQKAETIPLLLEVLNILPEEASSSRVYVHPDRRRQVLQDLTDVRATVIQYLEACLNNAVATNNADMQERVMSCLFGWLRWDIFVARELKESVLLTFPFEALGGGYKLFDVAKDVICELLRSSDDVARDSEVVQLLVPRVMSLAPAYDHALAKQDEGNNEEIVKGLCYIFSEMGESYLDLLVQGSPDALLFVQLLCKCAANPDPEVARRTFDFWWRLRKSITDSERRIGRTPEQITQLMQGFTPYFSAVCDSVIQLLKCSDDFDSETEEEQEDFRRLRNDVADVLADCCDVIGGDACLERIFASLKAAATHNINDWQSIEACFYAIRRINRQTSIDESVVLPQLLPMLPRLPNHEQLNYTAILVVGAYSPWVSNHPAMLGDLFTYVLSRLGDPKVLSAACIAIRNLCDSCRSQMVGNMPDLIKVFMGIQNAKIRDKKEVIEGICCVVSALPYDQIVEAMKALIIPAATELNRQMQGNPEPKPVCDCLQQITAVFQCTKVPSSTLDGPDGARRPHPTLGLFVELWPVLDMAFCKMSNESETAIEETCRVCKYTIKAVRHEFVPHLDDLMTRMISCYKAKARCSYLDVCAVSLVELHEDESLHQAFMTILQTFSEGTFQVLDTVEAYTENPDLVDDYFEFVKRYIQRIPLKFITVSFVHIIVQGAIKGACIDHHEASRAVLSFLTQFIEMGCNHSTEQQCKPVIRGVLEQTGLALMQQLFTATMGAVPIRRLGRVGALMKRMFDLDQQLATAWLQGVLREMDFVPPAEREKVCTQLLESVHIQGDAGDDHFGDILTDFAHVARVTAAKPPGR